MIKSDTEYIRERIARLRTQANVSARELSLSLGQSSGYINTIENGKSLPSMSMFLYICDYFHITPKEFFDEEMKSPELVDELVRECSRLDDEALRKITAVIKMIKK